MTLAGTGTVVMLVGSAGYYGVLAIRVGVSDGQELAGRLMSFEFIPVAYVLALLAVSRATPDARGRARRGAVAAGGVLSIGAVAGGWPPWWERLPGPYLVAGFERSVDAEALAVAGLGTARLGPNQRFGADAGNAPIIGTYGRPGRRPKPRAALHVACTDGRGHGAGQGQRGPVPAGRPPARAQLPASGAYFPVDPNANGYRTPLPLTALEKFDAAGASRLYDSGDIVVYDLQGSDYAP